MQAELKELMTSDIDPKTYWPEKEDNFGFYVQAVIGIKGQEGGDIFGFQVCTPKWIEKQYDPSDIIFARDFIIVFEYDFFAIKEKIINICNQIRGSKWEEVAMKLSLLGRWEFESYLELSE